MNATETTYRQDADQLVAMQSVLHTVAASREAALASLKSAVSHARLFESLFGDAQDDEFGSKANRVEELISRSVDDVAALYGQIAQRLQAWTPDNGLAELPDRSPV